MRNQYMVHGALAMTRGSLMRIEDGRGMLIQVREGALWITQERDPRDYFVSAGNSFRVNRAGRTVISAIARSSIALTAPGELGKNHAEIYTGGDHASESAAS
jgi:hypothetical protein